MTASVTYWRLSEEERDLVRYIESLEPTVCAPPITLPTPEQIRWVSLETGIASDPEHLLITPKRYLDACRIIWVKGATDAGYAVDVVSSPTLYYERGRMRDNRLTTTSITASWSYLADDGKTIVDKPADFVRWAKKVLQWVRRAAPGWYEYKAYRVTPKAEAARESGLELQS